MPAPAIIVSDPSVRPKSISNELTIIMTVPKGAHEHPTFSCDLCLLLDVKVSNFALHGAHKRVSLLKQTFRQTT